MKRITRSHLFTILWRTSVVNVPNAPFEPGNGRIECLDRNRSLLAIQGLFEEPPEGQYPPRSPRKERGAPST
ncbi:hypothetical protein BUE80_DR012204 [Diplocarpon rosae]|nr:hypothetical protein BUE80_DR012204 [Diplocarpon rosae]